MQLPLSEMAGEAPLRRELPQDIEAEQGLLGSILLDPARVLDICTAKGVVAEAFVEPSHRSIYAAITRLASKGQPVDGITVSNFLKGTGDLEAVGGVRALTELMDRTPTSAHAGYYAELVMEQYLRRCILGAVREVEANVYDSSQSADYVLGMAEQTILGIGEGRTKAGTSVDWRTSVGETLSMLTRQLEHPGELSGIPTGFKALDNQLRGLHRGEMIVLAARPSMGKTSLAMNIAECVARGRDIMGRPFPSSDGRVKKRTVLVFSLEMPQMQLTTRMLCGIAGVSAREVEKGQFVKKEVVLPLLRSAAKELQETPILCDDQGGLDVMELRARARHAHKRNPVELIVIDYLQLLSYREFAQQGQQVMVAKISGEIKAMAKELNVPVLVLSQLSRNPEQRGGDEKPKNSDLRDSGAIEQDADVILLLRRPCFMGSRVPEHDDRLLAIVDVSKNRNGATGEVRLNFDGATTRFKDRVETNPDMMTGDMEPVE
ncbi:MAG TPA: replicative DNA helicase [Candidatus Spyradenecus faecavium]|uniref:Replicative DNA helicase n=1 Tax=Candidatus Spyradenecus faecavium TaxID=2840947 RepID=A0A9D1NNM0_9BACT|nr:replicative DNA helicase [Candidatus Spyradenecus faecavium]